MGVLKRLRYNYALVTRARTSHLEDHTFVETSSQPAA